MADPKVQYMYRSEDVTEIVQVIMQKVDAYTWGVHIAPKIEPILARLYTIKAPESAETENGEAKSPIIEEDSTRAAALAAAKAINMSIVTDKA